MPSRLLSPRLTLILAGVLLGLLARNILGEPQDHDTKPSNEILRPLKEEDPESINLPLTGGGKTETNGHAESGLVPPIVIPAGLQAQFAATPRNVIQDDFVHDSDAIFESHGDQVCASGCALSRHPTSRLSEPEFTRLLEEYQRGPLDETNTALESLLYYGPQTQAMINRIGIGTLDPLRSDFLWDQLQFGHAKVSLRIVDTDGNIRSWLDATEVPLDRRHIFEMQTVDLQPLVTSGTVKRVGLNHAWVRL